MTKIQQYQNVKLKNETMIKELRAALGNGPRIDKNYIRITTQRRWDSDPVVGYLHGQYGCYGISSVTDIMNPNTVEYIRDAINKMMPQIVEVAIEMAKQDIEKFRNAAIEEAQAVLEAAK